MNSVYVFDEKLVLTYNYQHGTQTISLEEIESALGSDFDGATPPKENLETTRLNSNKALFSFARGRERCDHNGHAVFLRPGVDFATAG